MAKQQLYFHLQVQISSTVDNQSVRLPGVPEHIPVQYNSQIHLTQDIASFQAVSPSPQNNQGRCMNYLVKKTCFVIWIHVLQ